MRHVVGWLCYSCNKVVGTTTEPVVRLGEGVDGWPRKLAYLCPSCLFEAVRDGQLVLQHEGKQLQMGGTEERGSWSCFGHAARDSDNDVQERVMYLIEQERGLPDRHEFLCPSCLMDDVIHERLTVHMPVVEEAAPIGPTAITEEDGAVSVEGITFRW